MANSEVETQVQEHGVETPQEPSTTREESGSREEGTEVEAQGRAAASNEPEPANDDIWDRASALDADELLRRHPKLQGKLGSLAQKQAQKEAERLADSIVERRLAEKEAASERQRLEELADEGDLYALGQVKKSEIQKTRQQQSKSLERVHLERDIWSKNVDPVLLGFMEELDETERDSVKGRYEKGEYGEDPVGARKAYFKDVMERFAKREIAKTRKKWEKDELPALVKERLSEGIDGEPSPDSGAGGTAPRGPMTQEEFDRIKNNTSVLYLPEHWSRFEAGRRLGLITN